MRVVQRSPTPLKLGLGANWRQFALLVVVNAFVGAMVGQERVLLPLLAERDFGLAAGSAVTAFILSFGVVKALCNLAAGPLADTVGRRPVLLAGWVAGLPVPFAVAFAPEWSWVVAANALLGVNQGLAWSMTVSMKVDLVGPQRRGLALGLNEFAGYLSMGLAAWGSAWLAAAYGPRPIPFLIGVGASVAGLLSSALLVRETRPYAAAEAALTSTPAPLPNPRSQGGSESVPSPSMGESKEGGKWGSVFARATWGDRRLFGCAQAGLVNNLNDAVAWGLLPLFLAGAGLGVGEIGVLAATYPAVWGVGQIATGALSDRTGRKPLIVIGLALQGLALIGIAAGSSFPVWLTWSAAYGLGTALVYPTLLAAVADASAPAWRASALGVYRFWRDGGFAVGALAGGLLADSVGLAGALVGAALLTLSSSVVFTVAFVPASGVDSAAARTPEGSRRS